MLAFLVLEREEKEEMYGETYLVYWLPAFYVRSALN